MLPMQVSGITGGALFDLWTSLWADERSGPRRARSLAEAKAYIIFFFFPN
jgi:hypothetical protein